MEFKTVPIQGEWTDTISAEFVHRSLGTYRPYDEWLEDLPGDFGLLQGVDYVTAEVLRGTKFEKHIGKLVGEDEVLLVPDVVRTIALRYHNTDFRDAVTKAMENLAHSFHTSPIESPIQESLTMPIQEFAELVNSERACTHHIALAALRAMGLLVRDKFAFHHINPDSKSSRALFVEVYKCGKRYKAAELKHSAAPLLQKLFEDYVMPTIGGTPTRDIEYNEDLILPLWFLKEAHKL